MNLLTHSTNFVWEVGCVGGSELKGLFRVAFWLLDLTDQQGCNIIIPSHVKADQTLSNSMKSI